MPWGQKSPFFFFFLASRSNSVLTDFTVISSYLIEDYREDEDRLFQEMHNDMQKGNEHKLHHKNLQLDTLHFFTTGVVKYCNWDTNKTEFDEATCSSMTVS